MKIMMSIRLSVALLAVGALLDGYSGDRETPASHWDLAALSSVPRVRANPYPDSDYPGLKALLVEGEGPNGTKAEFFCYYGVPEGPVPAGGWPGILLVHGGGGTAYPQWVDEWRKTGVAVLAPDWYNRRPAPGLTNAPPTESNLPKVELPGGQRNEIVVNVANMVRAHSLLQSFPEVNAARTAFVGLSWGSWYGSAVAAVDNRFRGCVEIYCGDYNPGRPGRGVVDGRFLADARIPMWWVVSTIDRNVTYETSNAGFARCAKFDGCALANHLPHSHCGFSFPSVKRMAHYYVGLDKRLPRLDSGEVRDGVLRARVLDAGRGIARIKIGYTTSTAEKTHERKWLYAPGALKDGVASAPVPEGAVVCYLGAYEEDEGVHHDLCGTTPFFIIGK